MNSNIQNRYRIIVILLVLVNAMIVFTWWYVDYVKTNQNHDRKPIGRDLYRKDIYESYLKLDKSQSVQFKKLNNLHFKQLSQLNKDIDSIKMLIRDEIINAKHNTTTVNQLFIDIGTKRIAIDTTIFHHFERLRSVCDSNQLAPFDSLMNSFFMKRDRYSTPSR